MVVGAVVVGVVAGALVGGAVVVGVVAGALVGGVVVGTEVAMELDPADEGVVVVVRNGVDVVET